MTAWHRFPALVVALVALPLAGGAEIPVPALRELAQARGLEVGTAVKAAALGDDAAYRETLVRHFAVVTPENEMKWKAIAPREGEFRFEAADRIVDFAIRHGLAVRGHTLVWNADQHSPEWLLRKPADPETATRLMRAHFERVLGRYQGKVRDWDVVNEAVANDSRPGAPRLVDGYWLRALGEGYIAAAFRLAREIDPKARLFYNDYDHGLGLSPKSDRIYALLKQLKADGVPIDGVGLQLHCNLRRPPVKADLVANFRRLKALGLIVQVTELDVEVMDDPAPLADRLDRQARIYRDVFEAALETGVEGVVTWGFTDRFRQNALLRRKKLPDQDTPMWLFDADYRPKPAFHAVVAALRAAG